MLEKVTGVAELFFRHAGQLEKCVLAFLLTDQAHVYIVNCVRYQQSIVEEFGFKMCIDSIDRSPR